MKEKKAITLVGYFGFHNIGDELLLQTTIESLQQTLPETPIIVLVNQPSQQRKQNGVTYINRYHLGEIKETFQKSKLVLFCGGLWQDKTSNRSLWYYLILLHLANRFSTNTMLFGAGIGPITKFLNQKLLLKELNCCDKLTLRDHYSKSLALQMGVSTSCEIAADQVFHLSLTSEETIGRNIVLIPSGEMPSWERKWTERIKQTAEKHGITWEILDFQKTENPLEKTIEVLQNASLVISGRYHGLVLAALLHKPMIGIAVDPKITNICQEFSAPVWTERTCEEAEISTLAKQFDREKCESILYALQKKAKRNTEIAVSLWKGEF